MYLRFPPGGFPEGNLVYIFLMSAIGSHVACCFNCGVILVAARHFWGCLPFGEIKVKANLLNLPFPPPAGMGGQSGKSIMKIKNFMVLTDNLMFMGVSLQTGRVLVGLVHLNRSCFNFIFSRTHSLEETKLTNPNMHVYGGVRQIMIKSVGWIKLVPKDLLHIAKRSEK